MLTQFAANPDLRCGDVETVSEQEYARLARINDTGLALPSTTLADLVAEQASKTPDAPALADAHTELNYRQMREQVVALANLLRARREAGRQRGGGAPALGVPDPGAARDC